MRWMWKRALLAGSIGLAAGGATGCAEERAPINRVQANALAKSFFVGEKLSDRADDPEFWTQGTLVDVGYGAAQDGLFTSTYAQPISRIKWVIQEDLLLGRLTNERIDGTDGKGVGKATDDGEIAVAYRILSHFDIRREYNPTTGEESNIIVENTSDRNWQEREYMRVDWSQSLAVDAYDYDTLSLMGIYGGVSYEALSYYINDPNHEDAPHFDPETGYFDITNKAFATPATIDLSSYGWGIDSYPACFLDADFSGGSAPSGSCNPVELTIRQSFRRVVDKDYEPQDWDGNRFSAFGAFTVDRSGYARNYGMSDDKWHRFITRYNIWERSHAYADPENMVGPTECFTPITTPAGANPNRDVLGGTTPEGAAKGDGTEDECAAVGRGSRCDSYSQKCTLPFRDRKPVTQAWHYTRGSNNEFFEGTEWATHEWDVALRSAVMTSRYAECVRSAGPEDCNAVYPVYHGQQDENEDAVALAREVDDCRNGLTYQGQDCMALADQLGQKRGYDRGVIELAKMQEMIVLCHGPVEANDHAACGPAEIRLPAGITAAMCEVEREKERVTAEGDDAILAPCMAALSVRMGDLRYHQVNVMKAPQTPSPWGIYTDSEDPLTGEKVAASINVWSHVNDLWSQGVIDQIRYIKGELKTADVTEGTYVRDWVNASKASGGGTALPKMNKADVQARLASFSGLDSKKFAEASSKASAVATNPEMIQKIRTFNKDLKAIKADARAPNSTRATYEARRRAALGTELEAELTTKSMQEYAGTDSMPLNDAIIDYASPLRGANPIMDRDMRQMKEVALAERGACIMEAPAPNSMTGLADILEEKFGAFEPGAGEDRKTAQLERAEKMRKYVAQRAQFAVIGHEMGHSMGLRHNFISSADPWGYRPQYWQLRTKNGKVTERCTEATDNGEACVGPRYYDPMTDEERKGLIWMFMQSSIMDYAGENTQDLVGLGAYDFAAARMFYGETLSVHADPSYNAGTDRGEGMIAKQDEFGGILGLGWTFANPKQKDDPDDNELHYTELNDNYDLIAMKDQGGGTFAPDCVAVNPEDYKPATWNTERDGVWHPTVDGRIVAVNGEFTRCKQQKVDYMPYRSFRSKDASLGDGGAVSGGGASVDPFNRTRVPYGFASDNWADTGNLSVYRHDNGADPYELFSFLIAQQEIGHIFDNYRRNRQSFSVRGAANRTLGRYNEKMRDGAKGLGLYVNIYKDFALEVGYNFDDLWPFISGLFFKENILASGVGFDHFTRMMQRPEPGEHYFPQGEDVLRSKVDALAGGLPATKVIIPNGATGYFGDVGIGGKPLGNNLDRTKGDYSSEYTINAGSYYEKVFASMLLTESVDNFISSGRTDFLDARYRAVSMADLFPDGYRRFLANNLTGDDFIKGVRVVATGNGDPKLDTDSTDPDPNAKLYPSDAMGWTTWWSRGADGPEVCFPHAGSSVCSSYGATGPNPLDPQQFATTAVIDPQVGWEQQKFLIAWTLQYLPENAQQEWLDQMHIWEIGADTDPLFQDRIEFHAASGKRYVAKTYGTEVIFGKTVQKGIGARILEWANELSFRAYETAPFTQNGVTWYIPVINPATGLPVVKYDPTIAAINPDGTIPPNGKPGCSALPGDNLQCACSANRACVALSRYIEIPFFMRQALAAYGLADPTMKGIY